MSNILPDITTISGLSYARKNEILGHLFEPCPTLNNILLAELFKNGITYKSYDELIDVSRSILSDFLLKAESEEKISGVIDDRVNQIISAHPRLGPSKAKEPVKLSQHSANEQKSLQSGSPEEASKLLSLNELYERTFPGLRYVVFVNGRPRSEIMSNMLKRIERNDISKERWEAFNAMCDIAKSRAASLLSKL